MSKEKEYIQELFTKPKETFSEHLELPDNERIIFSGRFGIGKSTFLNHYFEKEKANYNVIHLYPVNYSVLQNEDIFRYIKYDILLRLLTITPKNSDDQYNYSGFFDGLGNHFIENSHSLFSTFLLLIPELGEQLNQFSKELGQFWKDYKDVPKSETEVENKEIYQFISEIHSKEGSIYETGEITQIIQNGLKNIKNGKKENILIIDDLDRIDPAHIFRILNVFSAHFDDRNDNSKNKFGFDRVILVCDIDNIRNLYTSIYGGNTDFNGYIDKFYSKEIYRYDNMTNINGIVSVIINSIKVGRIEMYLNEERYNAVFILKYFLSQCIVNNKINLRTLLKYYKKNIDITGRVYKVKDLNTDNNETLVALTVFKMLVGDLITLRSILIDLPFLLFEKKEDYLGSHIGELIYLKHHKEIERFDDGENSINIIFNKLDLVNIKIKVKRNPYNQNVYFNNSVMLSSQQYKQLLLDVIDLIH